MRSHPYILLCYNHHHHRDRHCAEYMVAVRIDRHKTSAATDGFPSMIMISIQCTICVRQTAMSRTFHAAALSTGECPKIIMTGRIRYPALYRSPSLSLFRAHPLSIFSPFLSVCRRLKIFMQFSESSACLHSGLLLL